MSFEWTVPHQNPHLFNAVWSKNMPSEYLILLLSWHWAFGNIVVISVPKDIHRQNNPFHINLQMIVFYNHILNFLEFHLKDLMFWGTLLLLLDLVAISHLPWVTSTVVPLELCGLALTSEEDVVQGQVLFCWCQKAASLTIVSQEGGLESYTENLQQHAQNAHRNWSLQYIALVYKSFIFHNIQYIWFLSKMEQLYWCLVHLWPLKPELFVKHFYVWVNLLWCDSWSNCRTGKNIMIAIRQMNMKFWT